MSGHVTALQEKIHLCKNLFADKLTYILKESYKNIKNIPGRIQ
jgi:hypothetical protein